MMLQNSPPPRILKTCTGLSDSTKSSAGPPGDYALKQGTALVLFRVNNYDARGSDM